jgi:hypothetical protein
MTPKNKHLNNGRTAVSAAGFFTEDSDKITMYYSINTTNLDLWLGD